MRINRCCTICSLSIAICNKYSVATPRWSCLIKSDRRTFRITCSVCKACNSKAYSLIAITRRKFYIIYYNIKASSDYSVFAVATGFKSDCTAIIRNHKTFCRIACSLAVYFCIFIKACACYSKLIYTRRSCSNIYSRFNIFIICITIFCCTYGCRTYYTATSSFLILKNYGINTWSITIVLE